MYKSTTASYTELTSQTYNMIVEAYAAANKSALDYGKSLWEVASRPYATSAIEASIQENFDRANKIVSLTVAELQSNGQKAAAFTEQLASQAAKLQESYTASVKGLVDMSVSNLNYVKDTATAQFEDLTKRVDEMQKHAVTVVSSN